MKHARAVAALSALAQSSRLAIYRHLVGRGPQGAFPGDLAVALDLAPATLSFHLKSLAAAGLVHAEPSGRHILYRADTAVMNALLGYLGDHCCGGQPELCLPKRKAS